MEMEEEKHSTEGDLGARRKKRVQKEIFTL